MTNERNVELLDICSKLINEGHSLVSAVNNMELMASISRDEFIEIEASIGAGARYVYNGLYNCDNNYEPYDEEYEEDGVYFDTPCGSRNNMVLLEEQIEKMPNVDPVVAYENALDATAGMLGLWDD